MTLWQRVNSFFGRAAKAAANKYGNFSSWFIPVNIFARRTSHTLATNETLFAAVSRLSNSMASLPLKLYRDYRPVTDHPAAELLINAPNPNMNGFQFIRALETQRSTAGNGYALKDYNSLYQVRALWVLEPSRVAPVIERNTKELWYRIDGEDSIYYVHNMDMLHVSYIHAQGYSGISPIDVLRNTVDFDTKVKEFSLEQIAGAIRASFILKMATGLGEDKKKEILESFRRFYQENGGVLLQEAGTVIEPIKREQSYIDPKIFETERITRTRVASVYNMPPSMLGEPEQSYNTREQMALEYVQDTLTPIAVQYEKEFNRKLLTPQERRQGLYFKFNVNAHLRGDMKTRSEFYSKGIRSGYFTPNEVRAWEDLPAEQGGDKLYVSKDLIPIDMVGSDK